MKLTSTSNHISNHQLFIATHEQLTKTLKVLYRLFKIESRPFVNDSASTQVKENYSTRIVLHQRI